MGVQIRRADAVDTAVVALLGRITFGETFGHLFRDHQDDLRAYLDRTFDVAKIERSLGKPENAYWLAFSAGLPVGYAKLKQPSAPPAMVGQHAAQLQKIYVLHQFLGQRIGRALLGQVMCEAAAKAPLIWLDVLEDNERAVGFYRKHGFAVVGADTYAIGAQSFAFHIMTRALA
jgi:ribosomal protein S18 acetylase RimI-like enzyme